MPSTIKVNLSSRLVRFSACRLAVKWAKLKQTTTHVEANVEMSRDAGSIPAASTQSGCTTRLDEHKARQVKLAGLARLVHVYRDLRDLA